MRAEPARTRIVQGTSEPNFLTAYSAAAFPTLSILDDIDNNGIPEAAVMLYRTSDGRITIQQRNASGVNAARNIWVSP